MNDTSLSLLEQMRQSCQEETWSRVWRLYEPLIRRWLIRYELQASDVDDVVQEVLTALLKDIAAFDHSGRKGAFRAWLKGILVNRLRKHWHARDQGKIAIGGSEMHRKLSELDDPSSQMSQIWNHEHDQHVLAQILAEVEPQFEPKTWAAFRMTAFEAISPKIAAEKLGLSVNAVLIAKSRALMRLRREAEGLVESSSKFFEKT